MRSLEREEDFDGKPLQIIMEMYWREMEKKKTKIESTGINYCIEVVEETAFNGKGKKKSEKLREGDEEKEKRGAGIKKEEDEELVKRKKKKGRGKKGR